MIYKIDNRSGEFPIYWISNGAVNYGITDIGQVSESTFKFITYASIEDWISDLKLLGVDTSEIEIESGQEVFIQKLYFSTPEERDAFNAAEAEFAGADPSLPYLETGEDELGYYLLVDIIAKPSLWQRFKNLF